MAPKKQENVDSKAAAEPASKKQKTSADGGSEPPRRSARQAAQPAKKDENKSTASTGTKKGKADADSKKSAKASQTKSEEQEQKPEQKPKSSEGKKQGEKITTGKKSDTYGSKNDPKVAPEGKSAASGTNLPKVGDTVQWKAMPGWVTGEVVEIVKESKKVQGGKEVKASADDPR